MRFDNVFWNLLDCLADDFKLPLNSADSLFVMIELLEIHSRSKAFNRIDRFKYIGKEVRNKPTAHR